MKNLQNVSLKNVVAGIEDSIIVLSGPALAISGIIAGVDVVTGGNILRSYGWLALAWAITLLLTLDFQVLCLGVRAHRVYASNKKREQKTGEIVLAILIACAISYVSIQMQALIARVNAENITIDAAALQLGVNMIALIWERSILVLLLIFMSGWLREHDSKEVEPPTQSVAVEPQADVPSLEEVLDKLDARYQMRMLGMQATLERTLETVKVTIAEATNPNMQAVRVPGNSLANAPAQRALPAPKDDFANDVAIYQPRFESKESIIAAILQRIPDASVEQVMQEAQCGKRTAEKWMKRLED